MSRFNRLIVLGLLLAAMPAVQAQQSGDLERIAAGLDKEFAGRACPEHQRASVERVPVQPQPPFFDEIDRLDVVALLKRNSPRASDRLSSLVSSSESIRLFGSPTLATRAVASKGPTPGMQLRRLLV
jgi:hypothetical protein